MQKASSQDPVLGTNYLAEYEPFDRDAVDYDLIRMLRAAYHRDEQSVSLRKSPSPCLATQEDGKVA